MFLTIFVIVKSRFGVRNARPLAMHSQNAFARTKEPKNKLENFLCAMCAGCRPKPNTSSHSKRQPEKNYYGVYRSASWMAKNAIFILFTRHTQLPAVWCRHLIAGSPIATFVLSSRFFRLCAVVVGAVFRFALSVRGRCSCSCSCCCSRTVNPNNNVCNEDLMLLTYVNKFGYKCFLFRILSTIYLLIPNYLVCKMHPSLW